MRSPYRPPGCASGLFGSRHRRGSGSRLDEDGLDRHVQIAPVAVTLSSEKRVIPPAMAYLASVRVGPLVDVVGDVVAPVLQEFGRGAGVVDLVEVHLQRLVKAVDAHREDDDDQRHDDPDVQLVEAAARLGVERGRSVGEPRRTPQAVPQPHDPIGHVERPRRGVLGLGLGPIGLTRRDFSGDFIPGFLFGFGVLHTAPTLLETSKTPRPSSARPTAASQKPTPSIGGHGTSRCLAKSATRSA